MKGAWTAIRQGSIVQSIDLSIQQVLAEYNGPQIVLGLYQGKQYLGVAADESDDAVRWIFAPVSSLELKALAACAQTTRDALRKEDVIVADFDHDGQLTHAWNINGDDIEERCLPNVGAFLPGTTRQVLAGMSPIFSADELVLEQRLRMQPGVAFKALSKIISVFQRLWIALADADEMGARGRYVVGLEDRATLSFVGASAGSLRIKMEPNDQPLFKEVAESFSDLVESSDNLVGDPDSPRQRGPRVHARYKELLGVLHQHSLELVLPSKAGLTFLGPERASRILKSFDTKAVREFLVTTSGYFVTYSSVDKKFEFRTTEAEKSFKGDVDRDVLTLNRAITVGEDAPYTVIIAVTRTIQHPLPPGETYCLRAAVEQGLDESLTDID